MFSEELKLYNMYCNNYNGDSCACWLITGPAVYNNDYNYYYSIIIIQSFNSCSEVRRVYSLESFHIISCSGVKLGEWFSHYLMFWCEVRRVVFTLSHVLVWKCASVHDRVL